jgi:hypothetical protein
MNTQPRSTPVRVITSVLTAGVLATLSFAILAGAPTGSVATFRDRVAIASPLHSIRHLTRATPPAHVQPEWSAKTRPQT